MGITILVLQSLKCVDAVLVMHLVIYAYGMLSLCLWCSICEIPFSLNTFKLCIAICKTSEAPYIDC